jgi:hypothetical protein
MYKDIQRNKAVFLYKKHEHKSDTRASMKANKAIEIIAASIVMCRRQLG